jgi:hypothetical protein
LERPPPGCAAWAVCIGATCGAPEGAGIVLGGRGVSTCLDVAWRSVARRRVVRERRLGAKETIRIPLLRPSKSRQCIQFTRRIKEGASPTPVAPKTDRGGGGYKAPPTSRPNHPSRPLDRGGGGYKAPPTSRQNHPLKTPPRSSSNEPGIKLFARTSRHQRRHATSRGPTWAILHRRSLMYVRAEPFLVFRAAVMCRARQESASCSAAMRLETCGSSSMPTWVPGTTRRVMAPPSSASQPAVQSASAPLARMIHASPGQAAGV